MSPRNGASWFLTGAGGKRTARRVPDSRPAHEAERPHAGSIPVRGATVKGGGKTPMIGRIPANRKRAAAVLRTLPIERAHLHTAMRRLTPETEALLRELYGRPAWNAWLPGEIAWRVEVIERVASQGDAAAIPDLMRFAMDSTPAVAGAARTGLRQLIATLDSRDLPELELTLRYCSYWHPKDAWRTLQAVDVERFAGKDDRTTWLGCASFHHRGYVRERAVRLLDEVRDGLEVPYLLLRLNDWVPEVRAAARESVLRRLRRDRIEPFVKHAVLLFQLAHCRRVDHADVLAVAMGRLTDDENLPRLLELLEREDRALRRTAFRLATERNGGHLARLLAFGATSSDPILRLRAARRAGEFLADAALDEALPAMRNDRSMPVRREALRILMRRRPAAVPQALTGALFDHHRSIRELAQFHLKRGGTDVAAIYRSAAQAVPLSAVALRGLGETGTRHDAALLQPFLTHASPAVRQAAVFALGRLMGDDAPDALLTSLCDVSPRVVREAAAALLGKCGPGHCERLWTIYTSDERSVVRAAVVRLLGDCSFWDALPYLLRAVVDDRAHVAALARRRIEWRYNRLFTKPSSERASRIEAALEEIASKADADFLAPFRQWLRGWQ